MAKTKQPTAGMFAVLAGASGIACAVAPDVIDHVLFILRPGNSSSAASNAFPARPDAERPDRFRFTARGAFDHQASHRHSELQDEAVPSIAVAERVANSLGFVAGYQRRLDAEEFAILETGLRPEDSGSAKAARPRADPAAHPAEAPPIVPSTDQKLDGQPVAAPAAAAQDAPETALPAKDSSEPATANTAEAPVMRIELQREASTDMVVRLPVPPRHGSDSSTAGSWVIQGLPAGVSVSKGAQTKPLVWQLSASDAASAELRIAAGAPRIFEITIAQHSASPNRAEAHASVLRVAYTIADRPAPSSTTSAPGLTAQPAPEAVGTPSKSTEAVKPSKPVEKDDNETKQKQRTSQKPSGARQRSASRAGSAKSPPQTADVESGPKQPFGLPAGVFNSQN